MKAEKRCAVLYCGGCKGHTLRDRARSLINIAHPDFRAGLVEEFEKRFHCRF